MSFKTTFYGTKESATHNKELTVEPFDGGIKITIDGESIVIDRLTAVRFSKQLRYEISRLTKSEMEANNG